MTYDTPDWIEIVRDAAIVLAFLVAVVAAVTAVGKFFIVKPLERYIDARTPKNGGRSLGELHDKVDLLTERIIKVETDVTRVERRLDSHTT